MVCPNTRHDRSYFIRCTTDRNLISSHINLVRPYWRRPHRSNRAHPTLRHCCKGADAADEMARTSFTCTSRTTIIPRQVALETMPLEVTDRKGTIFEDAPTFSSISELVRLAGNHETENGKELALAWRRRIAAIGVQSDNRWRTSACKHRRRDNGRNR